MSEPFCCTLDFKVFKCDVSYKIRHNIKSFDPFKLRSSTISKVFSWGLNFVSFKRHIHKRKL